MAFPKLDFCPVCGQASASCELRLGGKVFITCDRTSCGVRTIEQDSVYDAVVQWNEGLVFKMPQSDAREG